MSTIFVPKHLFEENFIALNVTVKKNAVHLDNPDGWVEVGIVDEYANKQVELADQLDSTLQLLQEMETKEKKRYGRKKK